MDAPLSAMRAHLQAKMPDALAAVLAASGRDSFVQVVHRTRKRAAIKAAVSVRVAFDETDPRVLEWIREHAAESIDDISDTTRQEIRDLIEAAFSGEMDVADLEAAIADVIGDEVRAENIARYETMEAANEGQRQAWDQAVDDGLLNGDEQREWIVTPDEKLCPVCGAFEGATAALNDDFVSKDGERSEGPPIHPRCRCTEGLVIP